MVACLTQYLFFVERVFFFGGKSIVAGSMEPHMALLTIGKRIVLFRIGTQTTQAATMKGCSTFPSSSRFFFLHILLEFPLFGKLAGDRPLILLENFITAKEVKKIYLFGFEGIQK